MFESAWCNAILGLSVSLVLGTLLTPFATNWLHDCARRKACQMNRKLLLPERVPFPFPMLIGVLERLIFTMLLVCNVSASGAFIGTWILAKIATGWNRYTKPEVEFRMVAFVGLIGSMISLFFALLGAILWNPKILP